MAPSGIEENLSFKQQGRTYDLPRSALTRVTVPDAPPEILAAVALVPGAEQRDGLYRAGDRVGLWWAEHDGLLYLLAMGEVSPGHDILRLERVVARSGTQYGHLHFSSDPEVIGPTYPQISDFHNPPDPAIYSDRTYSRPHATFLDGSVDLTLFEMKADARMTDLVSASILTSTGIIVSDKMRAVLEPTNLSDAAFHPCLVHHRGTAHKMSFLQLLESRAVDLEMSVFVTEVPGDPDSREPVEATSLEELHEVRSGLIRRPGRPSLLPHLVSVASAPDLFRMPVTRKLYVSEGLQARLAEAGVTGYRIDPLDTAIA